MLNVDLPPVFSFPEMQYYHQEEVRELMVNVLFCYSREHEYLSYRQVRVVKSLLFLYT